MHTFLEKIEQLLADFTPFSTEQAVVFGNYFAKNEEKVSYFIDEIRKTAAQLSQQSEIEHAEIYAKRLLDQVDALQKAVKSIKPKSQYERFNSSYHFPKNVHTLPPEKRLSEYRKALRALNDKISWLFDKQYNAKDEKEQHFYQQQIQETEFRKLRCLKAIEELAEGINVKK